jgi:hypothetical protein
MKAKVCTFLSAGVLHRNPHGLTGCLQVLQSPAASGISDPSLLAVPTGPSAGAKCLESRAQGNSHRVQEGQGLPTLWCEQRDSEEDACLFQGPA